MPTCTNGHESDTSDYCSICGIAFGEPDAAPVAPPVTEPPPPVPDRATGPSCTNCDSPRNEEDVFCENCGYDFLTGTAPAPEPVVSTGEASEPSAPSGTAPDLEAVVGCDREYFDLMAGDSDLGYPDPEPAEVRIPLTGELLIGRYSQSRGVYPEIDSLATSGDPAVSSRHAMLRLKANGLAIVVDVGSTNGTYLDGATEPIVAGVETELVEGSILRVGAWTRITIAAS